MKLILSKSDVQAIESFQYLSEYCGNHGHCSGCIFSGGDDGCFIGNATQDGHNIGEFDAPFIDANYEVEG